MSINKTSLKKFWDKLVNGNEDERETDFLPAILEVTETPPSPVGRLVMWTILSLLTVGIIWSFIGTIDEVAVATGKVVPIGQVKTIQSKNKGIIKQIYVKEGDYVKQGDLLVELDPTSTGADLQSLKKRAAYFALDIDRLTAELNGVPFMPKASADLEEKDIVAQTALYQSRVSQYNAEKLAAEKVVEQKKAQLNSEEMQYERYIGVLEIAQEKEDRLETLVQENAVARFQLLEQKAQRIDYDKSSKAQLAKIENAKAELSEAYVKLTNADAVFKKDVMTNLVEARKQYYALIEEIKKADEDNRMSKIIAPVDGRVNQLSVHTVGGIVTDAQPLMIIVPDDVTMEFEVWADNKDIGFIKEGQKAEVKVETFNFQKFGVVDAVVAEISPDALDDPKNMVKDKKYRLSLKVEKNRLNVFNSDVVLSPGMNVTAEVKIREKRIIDFFLDPFRQYTSESLRER